MIAMAFYHNICIVQYVVYGIYYILPVMHHFLPFLLISVGLQFEPFRRPHRVDHLIIVDLFFLPHYHVDHQQQLKVSTNHASASNYGVFK